MENQIELQFLNLISQEQNRAFLPTKRASSSKNLNFLNRIPNKYKMNDLSVSLLSSNKQLHQLNKQIMDLHSHYQQAEDQYRSQIKYRIKQSINKVDCMGEGQEGAMRKQELQQAFFQDEIEHNQLDKAFRQLFIDQYFSKTLCNKVIENEIFIRKQIQSRKLQAYPYSGMRACSQQEKEKQRVRQRQLQFFGKETIQSSLSEAKYEVEKQKHTNSTILKEVQLLEKELDNLKSYCQSTFHKKQGFNQLQSDYSQASKHDYDTHQQNQLESDQQLSDQADCLERLIRSKTQLISELYQSNHLLRLRVNELKARQIYLNKKRLLLEQSSLPKLQSKLSQLLQTIKYSLSQGLSSQPQHHQQALLKDNLKFKTKLIDTVKEISDINHLIETTLTQQIIRQKRHFIQNHVV